MHERSRAQVAALSTRGAPWGNDGPYLALQTTLRRLKLPGERLHALRAFFVTILLSGNVPVHVVRELVCHEDLATTQAYAAILPPDRGAAVGVLDRTYIGARAEVAPRGGLPPHVEEGTASRARRARSTRHVTRRIRALRSRVLRRAQSRGNSLETASIAA